MSRRVILVSGRAGSGKSTVARLVGTRCETEVINIGDLLLDHLFHEGINPPSRAEIGPTFISRYGSDRIFPLMQARCDRASVVFDGVRLAVTCSQMLSWEKSSQLWLVHASPAMCRERLRLRLRSSVASDADLMKLLSRATLYDSEQQEIQILPHRYIDNDGSLEDLERQVNGILLGGISGPL